MTPRLTRGLGLVLLLLAARASAFTLGDDVRIHASNLAEFQVGRDPTLTDEDRQRFFDQFILDLVGGEVRLGLRVERYQDSLDSTGEYNEVTQRFVEFDLPGGSIRFGHGYATLGRGLLFRAFELPGVVRQLRFPAASYADSRDLDGATARWGRGPVDVTLVSGRPTVNLEALPGADPPRQTGSVTGGHGAVRLGRGVVVGTGYIQVDNVHDRSGADLGLNLNELLPWELPVDVTTYMEYAGVNWRPLNGGLDTNTGTPHALYTSTEVVYARGGVSLETKDYHQFNLFINDPPSLVPEFSQKLLNRTTHFLETQDEKGHQLAWFQSVPTPGGDLVVEVTHAAAVGRRMLDASTFQDRMQYELLYASLATDPAREWQAGIYGATDRDEFDLITDRRTLGVTVAGPLTDRLAFEIDVAHQVGERALAGAEEFDNFAASALVSLAGRGQVGVEVESSNDPFVEDDALTAEVETDPRRWLSAVASVRLNARHQLVVFAGERRGGTACVSGTCYIVPDFDGLEMRLVSRF